MIRTTPVDNAIIVVASRIVTAYVAKHTVPANRVPDLITRTFQTLKGLGQVPAELDPPAKRKPAVPIRQSVQDDYLISLEDGQRFRSLKRHLMTRYGMTPEAYRAKWDLPKDYPMVAPSYAARRSELAREIGLGNRRKVGVGKQ